MGGSDEEHNSFRSRFQLLFDLQSYSSDHQRQTFLLKPPQKLRLSSFSA